MINNILLISKNQEENYDNISSNNNYGKIKEILLKGDYNVYNGSYDEETIKRAETNNFDMIIIKCDFKDDTEINFCKDIKSRDIIAYILFISNEKDTQYLVKCLDNGGDDFIYMPIDEEELYARFNAISRRMRSTQEILRIDDLVIDTSTRIVKRAGHIIDLTAREYALLEFLVKSKGKKLSRKDISQNVWGIDFDTGTNVIDVYIKYLREKIKVNNDTKPLIHTVYGYGYIMELKDKKISAK